MGGIGTERTALDRLAVAARLLDRGRGDGPAVSARAGEARPILTERMVLRPLRASDCVEFLRVLRLNRGHLSRFFPLTRGDETDLEVFSRELRLCAMGRRTGDWRRAAFTPDGRLIGCFNLNAIARGLVFRAEMTMWVGREFAGRGYAGEGLRAVLGHAFADPIPGGVAGAGRLGGLGLHRIDAFVDPANGASVRVLQNQGFRRHEPNVRLGLTVGGRSRLHDLYTRYIALPSMPVLEFKLLPAHLRALIGPQIAAIVDADPVGEVARAAA